MNTTDDTILLSVRAPEWLQIIRAINEDWLARHGVLNRAGGQPNDLYIGTPTHEYVQSGERVEVYPDFRVVIGDESGCIQAKTPEARAYLHRAIATVLELNECCETCGLSMNQHDCISIRELAELDVNDEIVDENDRLKKLYDDVYAENQRLHAEQAWSS